MRSRAIITPEGSIPLFAEKPSHPFIPLDRRTAGARSEGQGRPSAGASPAPLTTASTLAGWRRSEDRAIVRYAGLLLAGVLAIGAWPVTVSAQGIPAKRTIPADPYAAFITEASQRFGVPARWIRAVMGVESAYDPLAVSPAGAMGLMQVMPSTWRELRVRYSLGDNPIDPRSNILAGAAYLREMHDRYGTITGMLAAYNAGPRRYDDYLATGRILPAETRAYVATLAPILGGEPLPDARMAAAPAPPLPPPDWREAPLFVVQPGDMRTAAASSSAAQSDDARSAIPARGPARAEPQDGSIFVARASEGGT